MNNRFFEMDSYLKACRKNGNGNGTKCTGDRARGIASAQSLWSEQFSAPGRALVILIENGGIDLGIPTLVDKVFSIVPGLPDSIRQALVDFLGEKIRSFTDSMLETLELSVNRYSAAKPDLYGDVVILRDSTATYQDLKNKLIALSKDNKIIDIIILTHGRQDHISVTGDVDSSKIRAMKTEYGKLLSIRSVYMMNCVGSSLNSAWTDAGAKVSAGSTKNNYLPEPTTYFFWKAWKEGKSFQDAVTSAYQKTIDVMNNAVRGYLIASPLPGTTLLASMIDFADYEFVKDSAPQIRGDGTVKIDSDSLTFTQSISSGMSVTVLPDRTLRSLSLARSYSENERAARTLSPQGVDFIKGWEGFRASLYNDPVGHCTVGYGTLVHTGNCDGRSAEQPYTGGVSEAKATELLSAKAAQFQQAVNQKVTVALNQNQNDALVSFVYNVGEGNFQQSTLLRLLNQGNYAAVPVELKKWTKGRQNGQLVDLPGLVRRRAAEAELFQKTDTATAKSMSAADYETDMQTIRDYVASVLEAKNKIATSYLSAIDNFQVTVQSASPAEAKPDILGVIFKFGLKTIEKTAITAVKTATGADLGPLVELMHAVYDEIDRAEKAAQNLAVADWIKNARTAIANAYTQDQTGEALRNQIEAEYKRNDEGGRGGYIAGVQIELEAMRKVQAPKSEVVEVALYVSWINQNFNNDCIDGTGMIALLFNEDGTPKSATVTAPLGDKIAGALNNRMSAAGISKLMDLNVVKKACKGDRCMCFEGNNVVRKAASDDAVGAFLKSPDTWKKFTSFS
jgi:GH24 family phage-related lysozyme (muramidase)